MLFVGEVPSLGGDWEAWPVGVAKERDGQGDLFGKILARRRVGPRESTKARGSHTASTLAYTHLI